MSYLQRIMFAVCLLTGGLPGMVCTARADIASPTAKELYDRGRKNYNLGHYEEALQDFEKAYQAKDDPAFLFNIAQCQRNTHRYEEAERSYRAYLRENSAINEKTREQVQKLIAEMEKAIEDQRAKQPPMGTQPPTRPENVETTPPSPQQPALRPTSLPSNATAAPFSVTGTAKPDRTPVYKKWWLWTTVGVVVAAGVGIGLGLALTPNDAAIPHTTGGNVQATLH